MFTIVIPTMWKSNMLIDFLYELVQVEYVSEIIIINNDYKNTPRNDVLFHDKVKMIDFGGNIFVNPAWNYGVSQSKTDHVCLMNDDVKFDTRLFSRVLDFSSENGDFGSMGLNPGVVELGQPPHTSTNIDFIEPKSGVDLLGYGCLMFIRREFWRDIPLDLKIYCGDAFIYDRSIWNGLKNYLITNISHDINYATTTTSLTDTGSLLAEGFLKKEGHIYENTVRKYCNEYLTPYINREVSLTPRKLVIDSFMFYNEYDILYGRLAYLYDHVDYFIITECNITHSGKEKLLNFITNLDLYKKFERKIIYHPFITDKNNYNFSQNIDTVDYTSGNWVLERSQRNHITTALTRFKQDAFVMISDADEIPSKNAIEYVKNNFPDYGAVVFLQDFFYYNLQSLNHSYTWRGTVMTTKDNVLNFGAQSMREKIPDMIGVYGGGWHLSYFGGVEKMIEKIENLAHQENNNPKIKDADKIHHAIENGLNIFSGNKDFKIVDASYFPQDFYEIFSKLPKKEEHRNTLNLVIGAAFNLPIRDIKRFVLSFRKYNIVDDLVLIINEEIFKSLNNFFVKNNVKAIINDSHKILDIIPHSYRYYLYADYLKNNLQYRSILLSDVRDVIFQENPFSELPSDFLYLFNEDANVKVQDEEFNSFWLKYFYGDESFNKIKNNNIICSGTILGSQIRIIEIINLINTEILRLKKEQRTDIKTHTPDQGIVNWLYNQPNNRFFEIKKSGDIIATVGCSIYKPQATDQITADNEFIYVNGKKPCVIHQYDRSPVFSEIISKLYD